MVQYSNKKKICNIRKINKRTSCSPRDTYKSDSNYRLDRHATKKAQRHHLHQAPTQVLDNLYSIGAQKKQHKKGVRICLNNNWVIEY